MRRLKNCSSTRATPNSSPPSSRRLSGRNSDSKIKRKKNASWARPQASSSASSISSKECWKRTKSSWSTTILSNRSNADLEHEQAELQALIEAKQAEITEDDEKYQDLVSTWDIKWESIKPPKPLEANKTFSCGLLENLARNEMYWEDLLSKYTIIKEIGEEEHEKHIELKDIKNEYFFLLQKDRELKDKVIKLQPILKDLITEIGDNKSENNLDEWVNTLRKTLEDCIISEEKFQKAAYYDPKEYFQFERWRRQPLNTKVPTTKNQLF